MEVGPCQRERERGEEKAVEDGASKENLGKVHGEEEGVEAGGQGAEGTGGCGCWSSKRGGEARAEGRPSGKRDGAGQETVEGEKGEDRKEDVGGKWDRGSGEEGEEGGMRVESGACRCALRLRRSLTPLTDPPWPCTLHTRVLKHCALPGPQAVDTSRQELQNGRNDRPPPLPYTFVCVPRIYEGMFQPRAPAPPALCRQNIAILQPTQCPRWGTLRWGPTIGRGSKIAFTGESLAATWG
mmetsp:Transcript_81074/g.135668  ORF Transcript_81074/g.135668 Transcript_81074/m.135668 type:complete len:240 (-) Transcript_81074:209-928(-)